MAPRTGTGDCLRPGWGEGVGGKKFGTVAEVGVMQWVSIQVVCRRFVRKNGRLLRKSRIERLLLSAQVARRRIGGVELTGPFERKKVIESWKLGVQCPDQEGGDRLPFVVK